MNRSASDRSRDMQGDFRQKNDRWLPYSASLLYLVFSTIFRLNASYVGTPRSTANVRAALKHPLELKCQYTGGDADGQFVEWFKDGVELSKEKSEHYGVETTDKESVLTIKAFGKKMKWSKSSRKVSLAFQWPATRKWIVGMWQQTKPAFKNQPRVASAQLNVTDGEPKEKSEFISVSLVKPSPQVIKSDRKHEKFESTGESVRRTQKESIHLTCEVLPEPDQNDPPVDVQWDFSFDGTSFSSLPDNVVVNKTELIIDQISKSNRGYYRCTSNNVSFSVLLRVKGSLTIASKTRTTSCIYFCLWLDRLAALWPFVGIVCTVIFCVFVILLIEKRQKAAKKALAAEDDTHDQANDQ